MISGNALIAAKAAASFSSATLREEVTSTRNRGLQLICDVMLVGHVRMTEYRTERSPGAVKWESA